MYGGETSSMWSDVGNGIIFIIFFTVAVSIASIVCGGLLIDFYYKYIDDSNYNDLKDGLETLFGFAIALIGIPIIALIIIVLCVRFERLSYIFIAGFFCLVNLFIGANTLSKKSHLTRKINNKIINNI
jgi:hypothetical protein